MSQTLPAFEIRKSEDRGVADLGWLKSRHTFSFGHYRDVKQTGFSDLLVINDDRVQAGAGFGAHPHRDMEIFSYVLSGELEHKDSMGTGSVIRPGDAQLMSAGTGVTHSEFNPSKTELVHFLQIWIVPDRTGLSPSYQQANFSEADKRGKLRIIISEKGEANSLKVHQDVKVFAGLLNGAERFSHEVSAKRYAYVHIASGELMLNGEHLREGDGVRVRTATQLSFSEGKNAEILVFDLANHELPELA